MGNSSPQRIMTEATAAVEEEGVATASGGGDAKGEAEEGCRESVETRGRGRGRGRARRRGCGLKMGGGGMFERERVESG